MSFSSDVKKELAGLLPEKTCCRAAEAYGLLQMGHAFTGGSISLQTENDAVAGLYTRLVPEICGIPPLTAAAPPEMEKRKAYYIVTVEEEAQRRRERIRWWCWGCAAGWWSGSATRRGR